MNIARTAAAYGAHCANRTRVVELLRQGERVTGAVVVDLETGRRLEVRAKQVVNATGVWTDDTQALAAARGQFKVRASKGVHLLVPRDRIQSTTGLILRTATSVLFVIPVGTALDRRHHRHRLEPRQEPPRRELARRRLPARPGQPRPRRPAAQGGRRGRVRRAASAAARRVGADEQAVARAPGRPPRAGLVVVAGGKYTTYRIMAKDAVDEAVRALDARVPESVTATVPLVGAEGYAALWNQRHALAARSGLHVAAWCTCCSATGRSPRGPRRARRRPSLAAPLPGADDYLQVEVVYAVTHEGAVTSTTCSRGAPARRSSRGTAASRRRPSSPS
jgi:glycerol-3-phosphate dehydrogenase